MSRARRIECHTHVVPPETLGKAGKYGPEIVFEGEERILKVGKYRSRPSSMRKGTESGLTPLERVALMDRLGIDMMGITISPLFYMYWAGQEGITFAKAQNDALAGFCAEAPDRYFFMPTLPLQDMGATTDEFDRSVGELGGRAINLATGDIAGRYLDDDYFRPLYERAVAYDVPLFLHPYPLGISAQEDAPREDRYNLSWIVGYISQESEAVAQLIFGGVLDDFPGLKVCLPHGGGMIPYQFGRLAYAADKMPDVLARKRPLDQYLKNFYFDLVVHDLRARKFLVDIMGADNLIVGSNYGGWDKVNAFDFLDELALDEGEHARISGDNAAMLFKL